MTVEFEFGKQTPDYSEFRFGFYDIFAFDVSGQNRTILSGGMACQYHPETRTYRRLDPYIKDA